MRPANSFCVIALLTAAFVAAGASTAAAEQAQAKAAELQQLHARLVTNYEQKLAQLSNAGLREWLPKPPASGGLMFVASDEYAPADSKSGQNEQLKALRTQQADLVFALAKQAAEAGELSLAIQWATETLRENPNHAEGRRVLGYEQRDGKWLTAYGVQMFDAKERKGWHPDFGWIAPTDVARYEGGERLVNGRWLTADADSVRRTNMSTGWQVRSDHFLVRTDHSQEAAADLAARLERLHQIWRQLFAGFYLSDREVRDLFAGKRPPRMLTPPMRVFLYRDRTAYLAALVKRQPLIADTLGIYFDVEKEAHFYVDGQSNVGTLYHEAVHQLFQESRTAARRVGSIANFWIIEGVATYFETLREHSDDVAGRYYTIGEADAGRLPAARERLFKDEYYVPLRELVALGKDDLQRRPDIAKLYSQSSGLAAFLMDAEKGRYREPLVRYLNDVYAGRDNAESLSKATGMQYPELDMAYRRYLVSLP